MGLLNNLPGFRWSLYIVRNGNQLAYAMHEHSVIRMAGYVMGYFADGGRPVEPWSLYLNFNPKHQTIKLGPEHFTPDGENITPALLREIESIDPGWKVKGAEPVFEEATPSASRLLSTLPAKSTLRQCSPTSINPVNRPFTESWMRFSGNNANKSFQWWCESSHVW
ncbi:MAG: hypothetical protein HY348_05730 [Nitrospira defluvii]|nr:hypothetical protein [Nitrospira defluvii]